MPGRQHPQRRELQFVARNIPQIARHDGIGLCGHISTAAAEQRDGAAMVNAAMTQLDDMTQQNAALVELSATASASLREHARRLGAAAPAFHVGIALPAAGRTASAGR